MGRNVKKSVLFRSNDVSFFLYLEYDVGVSDVELPVVGLIVGNSLEVLGKRKEILSIGRKKC